MRRSTREAAVSDSTAASVPADAAFGLRVHSGWAALVAVSGPLAAPAVLARRRLELVDRASPGGRQPFHAARGLPLDAARPLVDRALDGATRMARGALATAAGDVRRQGCHFIACGLIQSSARPLPAIGAVLASHALVHTAEGRPPPARAFPSCASRSASCSTAARPGSASPPAISSATWRGWAARSDLPGGRTRSSPPWPPGSPSPPSATPVPFGSRTRRMLRSRTLCRMHAQTNLTARARRRSPTPADAHRQRSPAGIAATS